MLLLVKLLKFVIVGLRRARLKLYMDVSVLLAFMMLTPLCLLGSPCCRGSNPLRLALAPDPTKYLGVFQESRLPVSPQFPTRVSHLDRAAGQAILGRYYVLYCSPRAHVVRAEFEGALGEMGPKIHRGRTRGARCPIVGKHTPAARSFRRLVISHLRS